VIATCGLTGFVASRFRQRRELTRPSALLAALVAAQVTLGALDVLSSLDVIVNSVHVVCGSLGLTTSLVMTLRSWRNAFTTARWVREPTGSGPEPAPSTSRSFGSPVGRSAAEGSGFRLESDRGARV